MLAILEFFFFHNLKFHGIFGLNLLRDDILNEIQLFIQMTGLGL